MKINFSFKQFCPQKWQVKLPFMLAAALLMGITLSVLIEIGWGTDPATFMNYHVAALLGTDNIGLIQIMDYGVLLIFVILFGAQHIGFGSIANMCFIGFVSDFSRWVWKLIGFHQYLQNASMGPKIPIFAAALLLFVIAASIYMNSCLGIAPYDAIPKIISDASPKFPFFIIRIIFDYSAIAIGLLAAYLARNNITDPVASFAGIGLKTNIFGSACMSLLLGPLISVVGKVMKMAIPVFQDADNEEKKVEKDAE